MLEIKAKLRPEPSKHNKEYRKQGLVPAILYGHGLDNLALSVNIHDLEKVYQQAGESTLIKVKIEGEVTGDKERMILIHDFQKDPVRGHFIHVDFYQPKLDEEITAEVSFVYTGKSLAVADLGGVLIKNIHQIEVKALPHKLPREIEVDISVLNTFDDAIYVKDLKLPDGVKAELDPQEMIASIIPPRSESEMDQLQEKVAEPVAEVKTEAEEKKAQAEEQSEEVK